GTRMMAPGVGSFNIASPPTKPHASDDKFALRQNERSMAFLRASRGITVNDEDSEFPAPEQHNAARVAISALSFLFNALMLAAVTGPLLAMSTLSHLNDKQVDGMPFAAQSAVGQRAQTFAKLIVTNQKGVAEEALPLGIVIKNGSEGEKVTISGLPEGIELSLGTLLTAGKWAVS